LLETHKKREREERLKCNPRQRELILFCNILSHKRRIIVDDNNINEKKTWKCHG
jgi:hypothetical protein